MTLVKIILVIVFCFLQDSSFLWVKIVILVVASTVTFLRFLIDRPYYSKTLN